MTWLPGRRAVPVTAEPAPEQSGGFEKRLSGRVCAVQDEAQQEQKADVRTEVETDG